MRTPKQWARGEPTNGEAASVLEANLAWQLKRMSATGVARSNEGLEHMRDYLAWRLAFGVTTPSTNTVVQPEYDDLRPAGVTNHLARMVIADDPVTCDADFERQLVDDGIIGLAGAPLGLRQVVQVVLQPGGTHGERRGGTQGEGDQKWNDLFFHGDTPRDVKKLSGA